MRRAKRRRSTPCPPGVLFQFRSLPETRDSGAEGRFAVCQLAGQIDSGLFQITARVRKRADLDSVRDDILVTVRSLQEKPVDTARLDAVRKRLRYSVALQMQSNDAIAGVLAAYVALRRTPETMNRLYEQYALLTPEDVQQAAKNLVEQKRTIVTLTGAGGGE